MPRVLSDWAWGIEMQGKVGPRKGWGDLALSLVGVSRYTTATLLAIRTHEWKGRMDSTTHPVCIPAPVCTFQCPESSWNCLWCCWCKIGSQHCPTWTCSRAPHGEVTPYGCWSSWACFLNCIPSSSESHTPLPTSFPSSFLESCLPALSHFRSHVLDPWSAFLEHFMVTVALGFRLFNSLFLLFQYIACMRKAGAMDPFLLLFVIWFSLLQSGSTKQPLLPIRCMH